MDYIIGKYKYSKSINPEVFFGVACEEMTPAKLAAFENLESILTFEIKGNKYTFSTTIGEYWLRVCRFKDGGMFSESNATTVVTKDGNRLTFTTTEDDNTYKRIYDFSESGVVITVDKGSGITGKRTYTRIE